MAVQLQNAEFPVGDPIASVKVREQTLYARVTDTWAYFLTTLLNILNRAAVRIGSVSVIEQTASISTTDLTDGTMGAGVYRLTYYAFIFRNGSVSHSLEVTLGWTDQTTSLTTTGAAMTTSHEHQSGSYLVYSDAASPITVATTYASSGATAMQYELRVILEGPLL